jgi:mannose-6-phosphate isomerase
MALYPLKFEPLFNYRIWGGNKLRTVLNKNYQEEQIGESWEISAIEESETQVADGNLKGNTLKQLIKEYKGALVGNKVYESFGEDFPLLIKFIDAKTPLSIQVHPNDEIAKKKHNAFGKNEMWYIMQADTDAQLVVGFKKTISKTQYANHLKNGTLMDTLNIEKVQAGDVYDIPAGRVHAIGAGVLLAEIQQTSNVIYRIHDYDRIDAKTGSKRELHNDLAIDAIDFEFHDNYKTNYKEEVNASKKLIHNPYFNTNILLVEGSIKMDYTLQDSFVIYMCVEGDLEITYNSTIYSLNTGETILIPAAINTLSLASEHAKLLEVRL